MANEIDRRCDRKVSGNIIEIVPDDDRSILSTISKNVTRWIGMDWRERKGDIVAFADTNVVVSLIRHCIWD